MGSQVFAPHYPAVHRWPVAVSYGWLELSPYRRCDVDQVARLREHNASWLRPWDATPPNLGVMPRSISPARQIWRQARQGNNLPWLIRWHESGRSVVIGQCTVSNLVYGSVRSASIGYWIDAAYAGRSITPAAVGLAIDYCLATVKLHRIEICIRPENHPSLRVVAKLGLRHEGFRPQFIHIAGDWRDHEVFVVTPPEAPHGVLERVDPAVVGL